MNNRLAVSLIAVSLLVPGAAFAQSTTAQGAAEGAARVVKPLVRSAPLSAVPWAPRSVQPWKFRTP